MERRKNTWLREVRFNAIFNRDFVLSLCYKSSGCRNFAFTLRCTSWCKSRAKEALTAWRRTLPRVLRRRRNSTGTTPVRTVSIVPATTIKLYGSVNNQAKEIHKLYGSVNGKAVRIRKLYGSVNGQAVRIRKLYGSVNGRSKLIFEDNS